MITAIVLDMDGVMVDSELQWKVAEGPFFRAIVPAWRDDDHDKIVGLSPHDLYDFLVERYALEQPREAFLGLWRAASTRRTLGASPDRKPTLAQQ